MNAVKICFVLLFLIIVLPPVTAQDSATDPGLTMIDVVVPTPPFNADKVDTVNNIWSRLAVLIVALDRLFKFIRPLFKKKT